MRIRVVLDMEAGSTRVVEATTFLNGLVKHQSIHHEGRWALAHELSGVPLLNGIPRDPNFLLTEILPLLRVFKFNTSLEVLLQNAELVEALTMARNRIIGKLGERMVASELRQFGFDAKAVVGSGATAHRKCDIDAGFSDASLKVEAKTTEAERYALDVREFEGKRREAAKERRDLVYVISFVGEKRGTVVVASVRMLPEGAIAADVSTSVMTNHINIAAVLSAKVNTDKYIPMLVGEEVKYVIMSYTMLRRALT